MDTPHTKQIPISSGSGGTFNKLSGCFIRFYFIFIYFIYLGDPEALPGQLRGSIP